jgi:hypothetical protein
MERDKETSIQDLGTLSRSKLSESAGGCSAREGVQLLCLRWHQCRKKWRNRSAFSLSPTHFHVLSVTLKSRVTSIYVGGKDGIFMQESVPN